MRMWSWTAALTAATALAARDLPDPAPFGRVLDRHVEGGRVDYAAVRADRNDLDAYMEELARTSPAALAAASRDERLAFWINAYNACTLTLVIDHYPIEKPHGLASIVNAVRGYPANSIQQIPDTWKRRFCAVAGETRSLDDIEHGIIRPMGEPRIHFAVNCASLSCPVLAPEPYTGDALDRQLDAAVERFIANPRHYRLERSRPPVLHVNKVLDWYKDDFGGEEGVKTFLLRYAPADDARYVGQHGPAAIAFEDYDWTLNDTAKPTGGR